MKAKKATRAIALAASGLLATAGLVSVVPAADAAAKTTVVINETSAMTSLNSGTPDTNLVTNSDIGYLTGAGFWYYDDGPNLVRNTKFGTFGITKNKTGDFEVTYKVNPGQVWSDGVPITGADLLLSHVLGSSDYSKKAGLGDPSTDTPKFNSVGYGGPYDNHIKSVTLSADKMSVTLKYDSFQPDWAIMGPGPSPVHALVELASGENQLPSKADGIADTARFVKAFNAGLKGSNSLLSAMGDIWSNAYNITSVSDATNPLKLVSNGGFIISSAVTNSSVTLVRNAKYTSGPAFASNGIKKVIFSFYQDGAPAAQALGNGEIDVYDGQPDAATFAQLKGLSGVKLDLGTTMTYEHVDLRVGKSALADASSADYNGIFKGETQKAIDLRTAFLLALPRQSIVNKEVSQAYDPSNTADAVVMNSNFMLPAQAGYSTVIANNGSSQWTSGTTASRKAAALALVKKYYPNVDPTDPSTLLDVKMLFKGSQRRIDENALIHAAEVGAGFNVSQTPTSSWSTHLDEVQFDVAMFAWAPSAVSQTGSNANYQSDGTNNHYGWNVPALDTKLHELEAVLTDAQIRAKYTAADKIINDHAWTVPLYQWPAVAAYNNKLKMVKPGPLVPNVVWNYWQWHF